jgi:hypothetical protein
MMLCFYTRPYVQHAKKLEIAVRSAAMVPVPYKTSGRQHGPYAALAAAGGQSL